MQGVSARRSAGICTAARRRGRPSHRPIGLGCHGEPAELADASGLKGSQVAARSLHGLGGRDGVRSGTAPSSVGPTRPARASRRLSNLPVEAPLSGVEVDALGALI